MEIVQNLIEVINCLLEVLIAVFFFRAFQEPRFKKGIMAAIALAVAALFFAARVFWSGSLFIVLATTVLTVLLASAYRFKWYQAVFSAIALSAISGSSEMVIAFAFETLELNPNLPVNSTVLNIIAILLCKIITVLVILLIYKKRKRAFSHIKTSTFAQLLVLPFSTILTLSVFLYYLLANVEWPEWLLIVLSVTSILLILSNVLVFYLLDRQEELWTMEERLRQVNLQLQAQKEYYDELYNSQQEIRRSRHDQKNLLIAIQSEIDHGDLKKLRQLISSRLDKLDQVLLTNPKDSVLESILYVKQQAAGQYGIHIDSQIHLTRAPAIDELDLAVMLSNLIDNAVESLVRDGASDSIRCQVLERNENLLISVENNVYHPVDVNHLTTHKPDKERHGLGLPSVRELVNRYDGLIEITCESGVFLVNIILSNIN